MGIFHTSDQPAYDFLIDVPVMVQADNEEKALKALEAAYTALPIDMMREVEVHILGAVDQEDNDGISQWWGNVHFTIPNRPLTDIDSLATFLIPSFNALEHVTVADSIVVGRMPGQADGF